jgi:flagellin
LDDDINVSWQFSGGGGNVPFGLSRKLNDFNALRLAAEMLWGLAMGLSIQTNVTSLIAQENLRVNTAFQSNTIQQLTSGYRINSSGDDAAGLAVANQYRSTTAQLTQGVLNANNGVSVFQTVDGGLSNISQILDRLNTLATESASGTFSGNRGTINNEYQSLVGEINRQASNIGLNTGGTYNTDLSIFIGGGNTQSNSLIDVNLSGANNAVDAAALGLSTTSVGGGGTQLTGNTVNLNNTAVVFAAGGSQAFTFNIANPASGAATTVTATVAGGTGGVNGGQVIASLNSQLAASGITAAIGANGQLQFAGSSAFTLQSVGAVTGGGNAIATTGSTIAANTGFYNINSANYTAGTGAETVVFQDASSSYTVNLASGLTASQAVDSINSQLANSGITAVLGPGNSNNDINIQSQNSFSVQETVNAGGGGLFSAVGSQSVTAPAAGASSTGNAEAALVAIQSAVTNLGLVQGKVGAGENLLADAVNLAQSQITNFSAAQSRIRDADIATEAANLTKSQVLQQSSIAALAQANSAPQQLLTLLKQG